jgi:hypothetical protein
VAKHLLAQLRTGQKASWDELGLGSPALVFLCLFIGLIFLQLVPLPGSVIQIISPQAASLYQGVQEVTGRFPNTLSVVPYATKIALLQVIAYTGAFVLTLAVATSRKRIRVLAALLVCMGLFQVLYGMYQTYAAGQESIWWWPKEYYQGFVTGTYINKNNLAGFLELAVPMAFGLALSYSKLPAKQGLGGRLSNGRRSSADNGEGEKRYSAGSGQRQRVVVKKKIPHAESRAHGAQGHSLAKKIKNVLLGIEGQARPLLWSFLGVVTGVGLLLTSSRGGIVSLLLAACFLGGLLFFKSGYRRWGGFVLGACLVVFIYGLSVGMHKTLDRFERIDLGLQDRLQINQAAWPIVWDYPVLGSGLDTFEHVFPAYAPPELMNRTFLDAHNDWLQVAIETGLVGFGIVFTGYIWFLTVAIRQWFARRDPLAVGIGGGMIMALCSIGIHSLVDFNMHIPANALSTMVMAGLGWNALFVKREKRR